MKTFLSRLSALALLIAALGVVGVNSALAQHSGAKMKDKAMAKSEVTVIELAQTPGEFTTKSLTLPAGQYQFSVTNRSVDHNVGFVIQKASDKDTSPMDTAVPNSFTTAAVAPGGTQSSGVVTLTPGEYVYSCPLNPTPHYTIMVK